VSRFAVAPIAPELHARTLVLQNGLRHVSSQPGAQTVDVSTIQIEEH
jgi:hypothetical protein